MRGAKEASVARVGPATEYVRDHVGDGGQASWVWLSWGRQELWEVRAGDVI